MRRTQGYRRRAAPRGRRPPFFRFDLAAEQHVARPRRPSDFVGQAEVDQTHVRDTARGIAVDEHIGRRDIAVRQSGPVHRLERIEHQLRHSYRVRRREGTLRANELGQCDAGRAGPRGPHRLVRFVADRDQPRNAVVRDPLGRFRLAKEGRPRSGDGGEMRVEDLERDESTCLGVDRVVNRRRAARAEEPSDSEATFASGGILSRHGLVRSPRGEVPLVKEVHRLSRVPVASAGSCADVHGTGDGGRPQVHAGRAGCGGGFAGDSYQREHISTGSPFSRRNHP